VREFSPASSQSLGRRLDRVAMAHSFSVPRRPVVATSGGCPSKARCGGALEDSSGASCLCGGAREAVERLGVGGGS
jgi:hypothetical protein